MSSRNELSSPTLPGTPPSTPLNFHSPCYSFGHINRNSHSEHYAIQPPLDPRSAWSTCDSEISSYMTHSPSASPYPSRSCSPNCASPYQTRSCSPSGASSYWTRSCSPVGSSPHHIRSDLRTASTLPDLTKPYSRSAASKHPAAKATDSTAAPTIVPHCKRPSPINLKWIWHTLPVTELEPTCAPFEHKVGAWVRSKNNEWIKPEA
mmetsp:Transcript_54367/g.90205  ORF Transcript_54367/g.90205 Transcript_54367/m.90205 type:complete len:206 (+) Transcript_54367:150-767(+)